MQCRSTIAAARRVTVRAALCLLAMGAAPAALLSPAIAQKAATVQKMPDSIPQILGSEDRRIYTQAFRALDSGQPEKAQQLARQARSSLLRSHIEAESLLAHRAPAYPALSAWLAANPRHPLANRVLDRVRTLAPADASLPEVPTGWVAAPSEPASRLWTAPRLSPLETISANRLEKQLTPLFSATKLTEAESVLKAEQERGNLAAHTLARWGQQLAWRYYIEGEDAAALRVATQASEADSPSAGRAHWTAGLAAWRQRNCALAATHFAAMSGKPGLTDEEMAAARFWEARAHLACRRPKKVSPLLNQAARVPESFYGLLALRTLGLEPPFNWGPPGFINADWNQLKDIPAVQRAVALVRIGQLGRADRELKHLWGMTDHENYDALVRLASALGLPSTQKWLSQRPPLGQSAPMALRFPAPDWVPHGGWRVDKALVFALALQESNFQTDAVSRAGARGLLQLMPGTVQQLRKQGMLVGASGSLNDPVFNLEAGQTYLEHLRNSPSNRGLLPKILASYNAGPGAVSRWRSFDKYQGDPLLFIESIPYAETRHYVERVLQNYWLYQFRFNMQTASLDALANGRWPEFPQPLPKPVLAATEADVPAAIAKPAPKDAVASVPSPGFATTPATTSAPLRQLVEMTGATPPQKVQTVLNKSRPEQAKPELDLPAQAGTNTKGEFRAD